MFESGRWQMKKVNKSKIERLFSFTFSPSRNLQLVKSTGKFEVCEVTFIFLIFHVLPLNPQKIQKMFSSSPTKESKQNYPYHNLDNSFTQKSFSSVCFKALSMKFPVFLLMAFCERLKPEKFFFFRDGLFRRN